MKIGIDISQMAYRGTGVAEYLERIVEGLLKEDDKNEYVLFFSSLRGKLNYSFINGFTGSRVEVRRFLIPPILLDFIWNKLHIMPIEWLIGDVDVFISSDWTQPPVKKAKRVTILYDLVIYKYPQETAKEIVETQKRRLKWVKKECERIICISEATKKDVIEILEIEEKRLSVIYPGI